MHLITKNGKSEVEWMFKERMKELERRYEELEREQKEEIRENPLSQYSTSQLKAELKRRKRWL